MKSLDRTLRAAVLLLLPALAASEARGQAEITNSVGMRMVRIAPGHFLMGSDEGDPDERPAHWVDVTRPFYVGATEVTNAQYERFDPGHRALRGKLGFSKADDEAVVFVSWDEAAAFCAWLSEREGRPYRLPTEAEWEYAARAGTRTAYHTGDSLPPALLKNPRESWYPDRDRPQEGDVQPLHVGRTPPNAWGLYDVHGNVEEWTADWYGPYEPGGRKDPVGRAGGDFRVTRGGSHSTLPYYLRSANRMGTLPGDRSWLIGFRVVQGPPPETSPLPEPPVTALYARDVSQARHEPAMAPANAAPFFIGPRPYVRLEPSEKGPFFSHNHQPAITETPNGDLLAVWYTTRSESGRYLAQAASRLRKGAAAWDPASLFWDAPDRNDHGNALWWDGDSTLYHFSGLSAAATWGNLAMLLRTSTDDGATWSRARLIDPEHGLRNQVISSVIRTAGGALVVAGDAVSVGEGGTALHVSTDGGRSWRDPGGTIAGIHASVVELEDGRLMALGRGDDIEGRMPMSLSADLGATWTHRASPFPPIASTQRLTMLRLRDGPLFVATFADNMTFPDAAGGTRQGSGLFVALSYDEGETWPVRRLVVPDDSLRPLITARNRAFLMSARTAEPRGYLASTQARDGTIHLISTTQHYAFNRAWIEAPAPPLRETPLPRRPELSARDQGDAFPLRLTGGEAERKRVLTGSAFEADPALGATAEIRLRVTGGRSPDRGVDLQLHLGDEGRRGYHLRVTPDAVYAYDAFGLVPLATGLDNAGGMHAFRLAVGADGLVRVYRDGALLGAWSPAPFRDPAVRGGGPYLLWGASGPVEAVVEHVSYDLTGGWAP